MEKFSISSVNIFESSQKLSWELFEKVVVILANKSNKLAKNRGIRQKSPLNHPVNFIQIPIY